MSDKSDSCKETEGAVLNRQKITFEPDSFVIVDDRVYQLKEILNFDIATGVDAETGRTFPLQISKMKPLPIQDRALQTVASQSLEEIADKDWKKAINRFEAIKPLLKDSRNAPKAAFEIRAKEIGVHPSTLYRWVERYRGLQVTSTLIPKKPGYKSGKSRLSESLENIIDSTIKDIYLTKQRSTQKKVVREVMRRCDEKNIKAPGESAIRRRIDKLSEKTILRKRGFREKAKNKFTPVLGSFPNATYPLAVIQIDHTPVDIFLVDDVYRKPIGRPWITVAIDVYSRMIAGYYLSLDPPSETSVAMCVAHAILPKEDWLRLHKVDAIWEVCGYMDTIHTDNGAEFRSDTFRKACLMHGINLEYRPVRQPQYGGHIERLLETMLIEVHDLPGTTFSNPEDRKDYDSEKNAIMTFSEFEEWFVRHICTFYHENLHNGIGMTPKKKWEIGIFGNAQVKGRALPTRPTDPHSLLLDFLPYEERSIQTYGVSINNLNYYSDVLRPWINATDPNDKSKKRKFTFRIDPRDITEIWFFDPELRKYFRIPTADQSLLSMSAYEYKQLKDTARIEGRKSVNTNRLNKSLTELREHVQKSAEKTKSARMKAQRQKIHAEKRTPVNPTKDSSDQETLERKILIFPNSSDNLDDDDIQPFDDLA